MNVSKEEFMAGMARERERRERERRERRMENAIMLKEYFCDILTGHYMKKVRRYKNGRGW